MSKEKKIVPELRFPEFKNEGEWVEKKLDEVGEIITGNTPNTSEPINYNGNILFVSPADINDKRYLVDTKTKLSEVGFSKTRKIKENSVLFVCIGSTIGKVAQNKIECATNQQINSIVPFNEYSNDFLYSALEKSASKISELAGIQAVPIINKTQFSAIKLLFPKSKEQQKVASCFYSLDELIEAHKQKLDLLKNHKKGLMQNLFPQAGEKVPKWRFPEFKKDGEWVFEPFDKVYSFLVTNSFSREFLNYENGKVKNIHYGDIHTKFSTLFDITKEKVPYINSDVSIERIRQECYCKEGDIIFADASEDLKDVGKSIEIINTNNEQLLSGLHTLLARQMEPKLITGFGGYLFLSEKIRKQIQREAQGAKVLGISGTRISKINLYYPKNQKEQKKIIECLSSIDFLIKDLAEKLEQLKLHKKGLMQNLFPKTIG